MDPNEQRRTTPEQQAQKPDAPETYRLSDGTVREVHIEAPRPDEKKQQQEIQQKKSYRRGLIIAGSAFAALVLVLALLYFFVAEPVRVDGQSMDPTLHNGEQVLVTKLDYRSSDPELLDIICCYYPGAEGGESYIKRVVGLPGDTVELRSGALLVNGQEIPQPFVVHTLAEDFGPITVQADHFCVMGDNRQNSKDSRDPRVGNIPRDNLIGHARYVIFPVSEMRSLEGQ